MWIVGIGCTDYCCVEGDGKLFGDRKNAAWRKCELQLVGELLMLNGDVALKASWMNGGDRCRIYT